MNPVINDAHTALLNAKIALKKGDRLAARRWTETAIALDPNKEEPWLLLAALASPKASIAYLTQALEIHPDSQRARQGMHWAIQRYRSELKPARKLRQVIPQTITLTSMLSLQPAIIPWLIAFFTVIAIGLVWLSTPTLSRAFPPLNSIAFIQSGIEKSTFTPTPTQTSTPTPTSSPTLTPTITPSITPTALPTDTPPPKKKSETSNEDWNDKINLPPGVSPGERWIDVDLTNQRVHAYKGKNLLNSFVTSTGTWQHPTVTGQYRIYVKYRYADMAGPGYYLPNVPYVMYFYKGYGIHGTYWHNNFGTPMSHGCVNLRTDDAGWVYNWASVGTIVNIHY